MPFVVSCRQSVSDCKVHHWPVLNRLSVMLNDHGMYEHILEDDIFFGVIGMLECMYSYLLLRFVIH